MAACDGESTFVEEELADAGDGATPRQRYRRLPDGAVVAVDVEGDASSQPSDDGGEDEAPKADAAVTGDIEDAGQATPRAVTIGDVYSSVFEAELCTACHPSVAPEKTLDFSAVEKAYATHVADRTVRCNGKPYVTPNEPGKSFLWDLVSKDQPGCGTERMPIGAPLLSSEQLTLVKRWIEDGARR